MLIRYTDVFFAIIFLNPTSLNEKASKTTRIRRLKSIGPIDFYVNLITGS